MTCPCCDDLTDVPVATDQWGYPTRTAAPFRCDGCGALVRVEPDGDCDGEQIVDASHLVRVRPCCTDPSCEACRGQGLV